MSPDPDVKADRSGPGDPEHGGQDRGSGEPGDGGGSTGGICELCGGPVVELHCKILCLNCGYKRDCSDP